MARTSLILVLLGLTGAMSLLLGLVGIYGVVSYTVARRSRELGIRIALGARNGALQRMLLRHVLLLVGTSVALGLGGAVVLTRPAVPARRVTRIDPMHVLREE
jgi:ABC-type antimicrobial peptide transport system permease subunit